MSLIRVFSSLCLLALAVQGWPTLHPIDEPRYCVDIAVSLCRGVTAKYDKTALPNFVGHTDQTTIQLFTKQKVLQDLVNTTCSKDLVFLLCATLLPMCINGKIYPPCQTLCNAVYSDCIASIRLLNFHWPGNLNCSGLPNRATGMCIEPSAFRSPPTRPSILRIKASCDANSWKKTFRVRSISQKNYNWIFRAKLVSKTHNRVSVMKFLEPKNNKNKAYINLSSRSCGVVAKHLVRRKSSRGRNKDVSYFVLGNYRNDVLKISVLTEWNKRYPRNLKKTFRKVRKGASRG